MLGFDIGTGALSNVRWLGQANANTYANLAALDFEPVPVPEPHAWVLMLGGLAAVGALARRRRA